MFRSTSGQVSNSEYNSTFSDLHLFVFVSQMCSLFRSDGQVSSMGVESDGDEKIQLERVNNLETKSF